MEEVIVVCSSCESECKVIVVESDFTVTHCPICGEELEVD